MADTPTHLVAVDEDEYFPYYRLEDVKPEHLGQRWYQTLELPSALWVEYQVATRWADEVQDKIQALYGKFYG